VHSVVSRGALSFPALLRVCRFLCPSLPLRLTCIVDYLAGKLKVDEYVTHNRTLTEINEGFHDMHVSRFALSTNLSTLTIFFNRLEPASAASLT